MAGQDPKFQKEAADQNFDYMFKLLIIGNSSVGKTSFLFRYADDSFTSAFVSTVGIDFKVKTVFRHDKRVKLQIWVSITPYVFPLAFPLSLLCCFFLLIIYCENILKIEKSGKKRNEFYHGQYISWQSRVDTLWRENIVSTKLNNILIILSYTLIQRYISEQKFQSNLLNLNEQHVEKMLFQAKCKMPETCLSMRRSVFVIFIYVS